MKQGSNASPTPSQARSPRLWVDSYGEGMPNIGRTQPVAHIRNVSVIAHIDHGKSTLADRLIERAGVLDVRAMRAQVLDSMDLERERGITIKAQTVRLEHEVAGTLYLINLIDTPGHVDFTYEVSRSLAASEGSVLVVDATQGVEAQTIANAYLAVDNDHTIIPVLNKIDLAAADVDRVRAQVEDTIGLDGETALCVSAKTGEGINALLDAIVERIPPPDTNPRASLAALLVDSWYDVYLGVMVLIRVVDGSLRVGQKIRMMASDCRLSGRPGRRIRAGAKRSVEELVAGEVGFFTASIRQVSDTQVGDTVTDARRPASTALPGFRESVPVVFCGLYPADASDYRHLRDSLAKLHLNDASLHYEPESSTALGLGFRCGCLGLLHLEIIQERLEREFDLHLVTTAPKRGLPVEPDQWERNRTSQSGRLAGPKSHHVRRGAMDPGDDHGPRPVPRQCPEALHGEARRADRPYLRRQPRHGGLCPAPQ